MKERSQSGFEIIVTSYGNKNLEEEIKKKTAKISSTTIQKIQQSENTISPFKVTAPMIIYQVIHKNKQNNTKSKSKLIRFPFQRC